MFSLFKCYHYLITFFIILINFELLWFQALKSDLVPQNQILFLSFLYVNENRTVPATSIQKVEFLLPSLLLALHVYLPESSNLAWRILRMLLLLISKSSLVQSISGVGTPPREHSNSSGELYVTNWSLSSGLISGGPGHRINKHNSKRWKNEKRKQSKTKKRKREEQLKETNVSQHLPVTYEKLIEFSLHCF